MYFQVALITAVAAAIVLICLGLYSQSCAFPYHAVSTFAKSLPFPLTRDPNDISRLFPIQRVGDQIIFNLVDGHDWKEFVKFAGKISNRSLSIADGIIQFNEQFQTFFSLSRVLGYIFPTYNGENFADWKERAHSKENRPGETNETEVNFANEDENTPTLKSKTNFGFSSQLENYLINSKKIQKLLSVPLRMEKDQISSFNFEESFDTVELAKKALIFQYAEVSIENCEFIEPKTLWGFLNDKFQIFESNSKFQIRTKLEVKNGISTNLTDKNLSNLDCIFLPFPKEFDKFNFSQISIFLEGKGCELEKGEIIEELIEKAQQSIILKENLASIVEIVHYERMLAKKESMLGAALPYLQVIALVLFHSLLAMYAFSGTRENL